MLASCRVIHLMAPAQDGHILVAMPLLRRDILDAAVSMNRGKAPAVPPRDARQRAQGRLGSSVDIGAVRPSTAQDGSSRAPVVRASSMSDAASWRSGVLNMRPCPP